MNKYQLIISILSVSFSASAQKYVDIAKVYYSVSSANTFENSDSSTRIKEFGIDVTLPVVINADNALLTGLFYERNQTKLFESEPEETFSVVGLRAGLSRKHSNRWTGTYILIPKMASDFKDVSSKDFQLGAIILMKYTKRDNLNYKIGAYYNAELFGPFIVPLFGTYYISKNNKFEANLTLPFLVDVNYKLHDRLNVGINFNGQVRSYRLSEIPETDSGGYVVKASNELFSYLKFNLSKGLSFQARVGYSLGRSYRVYNESDKIVIGSVLIKVGDNREQLNTDFSDGFIYQASLTYRFIRNE
jgi:Domain of unknown function (DUF6268)